MAAGWEIRMGLRWSLLLAAVCIGACAEGQQSQGGLRPEQALCQKWGYDPNDPVCLSTFRRIPP